MNELHLFRSRILTSMGLVGSFALPALLVGGCDTVEMTGVETASMMESERLPPLSGPTAQLRVSVDTVEANRLATFHVTGAEPGATVHVGWSDTLGQHCPVELGGACIDIAQSAIRLETATADANGEAFLVEPVPNLADGSAVVLQAAAVGSTQLTDFSRPLEGYVDHPARSCGDWPELDPDDAVRHNATHLVCTTDTATNGQCESWLTMSTWRAKEIYTDARGGAVLTPNWSIRPQCNETSITDLCCFRMKSVDTNLTGGGGGYLGRPFEVAGEVRMAADQRVDGWAERLSIELEALPAEARERLVAYWTEIGRAEHGSVASFSRFNLELMALGAPSDLLAASTRAIADEIRHARVSFGIAAVFAGEPVGPGALSIDGALARSSDAHEVLVAAILEGCINETICAAQARAAAEGASDPGLRRLLLEVAEDETRHAELSWAFVRWMLATRPELRDTAARAFDGYVHQAAPEADPMRELLGRYGMTTADVNHEIALRVLAQVVALCADVLLGRAVAVEAWA